MRLLKYVGLGLALLCPSVAGAAGPLIWNGIYAKNLASGGIISKDGYLLRSGALAATGTRAAPQSVVAGTGISYVENANNPRQVWYIQGSGGAVDITASPQIAAPSTLVNQELVLIGRSDTNTVKLDDGTGLDLNGSYTMGASDSITLLYDGSAWVEISRR